MKSLASCETCAKASSSNSQSHCLTFCKVSRSSSPAKGDRPLSLEETPFFWSPSLNYETEWKTDFFYYINAQSSMLVTWWLNLNILWNAQVHLRTVQVIVGWNIVQEQKQVPQQQKQQSKTAYSCRNCVQTVLTVKMTKYPGERLLSLNQPTTHASQQTAVWRTTDSTGKDTTDCCSIIIMNT